MRDHHDPVDAIRRLAPMDRDRLAASWSDSDAKLALFQEITAMPIDAKAVTHPPAPARVPQRRRILALAAGIAVVAATLAVAPGLVFDKGSRAFAIRELPNGVLEVEMSSGMRDGHALAAELREYGVESDIELVAASPSMVGQVTVFNQTGGEYIPEGMTLPADGSDVWVMTIDPAVFRERLTIEIAVQPDQGQPYTMAAEVFTPGEVLGGLHCALGEPVRAADVASYVTELGLTPIWEVVSPTDDPSLTRHTQVEDVPEGEILSGYAVDTTTVRFNVRLDGVTLSEGWAPRLSDIPCTAEQAAAWD
ncbi:MAG TPA: hypothetical protein VHF25_11270 [Nitriliruptorales bacterium]|nr:hypothetical protein [Nitriliruptorales bacterium]